MHHIHVLPYILRACVHAVTLIDQAHALLATIISLLTPIRPTQSCALSCCCALLSVYRVAAAAAA